MYDSNDVMLLHFYVTSSALTYRVEALESVTAPRSVILVEALPSLDSAFGLDVIAVPEAASPQNHD